MNAFLPKEVSDKYDVRIEDGPVVQYGNNWGVLDLRALTVEKCEYLIRHGFPHISKRAASEKDTVTAKK